MLYCLAKNNNATSVLMEYGRIFFGVAVHGVNLLIKGLSLCNTGCRGLKAISFGWERSIKPALAVFFVSVRELI